MGRKLPAQAGVCNGSFRPINLGCGAGEVHVDTAVFDRDRCTDGNIVVAGTIIIHIILKIIYPVRYFPDTRERQLFGIIVDLLQPAMKCFPPGSID